MLRFKAAGGLETLDLVSEFGIKKMIPVLDRYSPLSYSIGDYVHRRLAAEKRQPCLAGVSSNHFIIFNRFTTI